MRTMQRVGEARQFQAGTELLPPWDENPVPVLKKVAQHGNHPYSFPSRSALAALRERSANPYKELPPPLHREVFDALHAEIQWGFDAGLAVRYHVQGHAEPRWLVVTQTGQLAA